MDVSLGVDEAPASAFELSSAEPGLATIAVLPTPDAPAALVSQLHGNGATSYNLVARTTTLMTPTRS